MDLQLNAKDTSDNIRFKNCREKYAILRGIQIIEKKEVEKKPKKSLFFACHYISSH